MEKAIVIKGARTNNLKNLDLNLPRAHITAIVGVAGAGKTSLAFHTVYAEGYLRYIESISSYIRQFLDKMEKPAVDRIEGLPPAIAFRHKKPVKNPRSIVATALDIFDYLRIIFAKVTDFYCPGCQQKIDAYTIDEIVAKILANHKGEVNICFEYKGDIAFLINRGYYFHISEGRKKRVDHQVKNKSIYILLDRIKITEANKSRLFEAIDKSITFNKDAAVTFIKNKQQRYPLNLFCGKCEQEYPPPDEHLFSFNSPKGACPNCNGFGDQQILDKDLIFDFTRSLKAGAILPFNSPATKHYGLQIINQAAEHGIDIEKPIGKLTKKEISFLMEGNGSFTGISGFFESLRKKSYKVQARVFISRYTSYKSCTHCHGSRFNPLALSFKFMDKTIGQLLSMTTREAFDFFSGIDNTKYLNRISMEVFDDIKVRLKYLIDIGLPYIHLNRKSFTLSKGEFQRINLAFILGSTLSDSLLIIDQPSTDLHPHDYRKMKKFLFQLKENGNTLLIVEHNKDIIEYADHIVELGPSSGQDGGYLVFSGSKNRFFRQNKTITQRYFKKSVSFKSAPSGFSDWVRIKGACSHNLKNIKCSIPLNALSIIAGVSGAGKTSLLYDEIYLKHSKNFGFKEVLFIDPGISRTGKSSNIASFFEIYTPIRQLFAQQKESSLNQYSPGHFSFNSPLGRCNFCSGKGYVEIEMQFLPSINVACQHCNNTGFKQEVLRIKYQGKNIYDILKLSVSEFLDIAHKSLSPSQMDILQNIHENGLGYLGLGQKLNTLSAGELQRIKLVKYLNKKKSGSLFLIDEPCFGLHYHDIHMVKLLFDKIIGKKNTIVAVEHNLHLIASADYIIELGPEGGDGGGHLVFQGPLSNILSQSNSVTGHYLKKIEKRLDK